MKRIFFLDYGEDPIRMQKMENVFEIMRQGGAEVVRTSRRPIQTGAMNLPLPAHFARPLAGQGFRLSPKLVRKETLINLASDIYRYDHRGRSIEEAYNTLWAYRNYIHAELNRFKPDIVIAWHQFNAWNMIATDWCKSHSVPVLYGEHGVLPGSWCFELGGQMGDSWIARNPARFAQLPISTPDRDRAERYISYAVENRLNRKPNMTPLDQTDLSALLDRDTRPLILYAGVNDYKAGLLPFSRRFTLQQTGDFITTETGIEMLGELARRKGWHVLFKPHPSIKTSADVLAGLEGHVTLVDKSVSLVDLVERCDVLATIVSQSAYMGVLHGKPVVLMGRMQLSRSGLVEDALFARDLEPMVEQALRSQDPTPRKEMLRDHVARLMKYYLIADTSGLDTLFPYDLEDLAKSVLQMDRISA